MQLRSITLRDELSMKNGVTLDLGSVTVLWGENDAGKSTLLAGVHDALAWLTKRSELLTEDSFALERLCLTLTAEEAETLARLTVEQLGHEVVPVLVLGDSLAVSLGHDRLDSQALAERDGSSMLAAWLRLCLAATTVDEATKSRICDGIGSERAVLLQAVGNGTWRASWSLRRQQVTDLGLDQVEEVHEWTPIVEATVGPVGSGALPTPVPAPADWQVLGDWLANTVQEIALAAVSRRVWEPETAPVGADALKRVTDLVAEAIHCRAPQFVPPHYRLAVLRDEHGDYELVVTSETGGVFSPRRLGRGYHLWLQLALSDTVEQVKNAADAMQRATPNESAFVHAKTIARWLCGVDRSPIEHVVETLADLQRTWAGRRGEDQASSLDDPLQISLSHDHRLYVIDEPEQHLHPRLQRQAARWMRRFALERQTQFLCASYAPAFLGLPGDTYLIHVERDPAGQISTRRADPTALAATDPRIRRLGMDRGELLAMYRAVLFVEGETDKRVIESLYPDRLREIGLLVQPFRGTRRTEKIVEAETLLRVLGPPFHVLIDNCDRGGLERVREMAFDDLQRARGNGQFGRGELAFAAALRASALREQLDIRIYAIEAKDILGALDQRCVAEVVGKHSRSRRWPGFDALVLQHGSSYSSKLRDYGLGKDHPARFGEIGSLMRERNLTAPELDEVLDQIEQLTDAAA